MGAFLRAGTASDPQESLRQDQVYPPWKKAGNQVVLFRTAK